MERRGRRGPGGGMTDVTPEALRDAVVETLADVKAVDVRVLDVRGLTAVTDIMVIAGATSSRHARALARHVVDCAKALGVRPLGVEGEREGEWILVDLQDVVVHVMLPQIRDFYQLERLWSPEQAPARPREAHEPGE